MTLREIKKSVSALNTRQLIELDTRLHELIAGAESKKRNRAATGRQVLEERKTPTKTYRLEEVRCGKKNCRCADGPLHGPYWYAYWTEGGRTKSQYIGKKQPRGARGVATPRVR